MAGKKYRKSSKAAGIALLAVSALLQACSSEDPFAMSGSQLEPSPILPGRAPSPGADDNSEEGSVPGGSVEVWPDRMASESHESAAPVLMIFGSAGVFDGPKCAKGLSGAVLPQASRSAALQLDGDDLKSELEVTRVDETTTLSIFRYEYTLAPLRGEITVRVPEPPVGLLFLCHTDPGDFEAYMDGQEIVIESSFPQVSGVVFSSEGTLGQPSPVGRGVAGFSGRPPLRIPAPEGTPSSSEYFTIIEFSEPFPFKIALR